MPDNVTQREAPKRIYLLDYGSNECTWCEDPSPSGEDHSPVEYVRADTARIAELERQVARLREAHIGSHSFTSAGGDCAPFVTMNFKSKDARDQFVSAHLDVIQAHHRATTALGGQP